MNYVQSQDKWIKENNIHIGSKVKILRSAVNNEGGWKASWMMGMHSSIGKEYKVTEIHNDGYGIRLNGWNYPYFVLEPVVNEFPKYFVVKKDNSREWTGYIAWLNIKYGVDWDGSGYSYYGFDGNMIRNNGTNGLDYFDNFKNNPTLFKSAKEFFRTLNQEKPMISQIITRENLKNVWNIACDGWRTKLEEKAKQTNPFSENISFTQDEVTEMFNAALTPQILILEKYFTRPIEDDSLDALRGTKTHFEKKGKDTMIDIRYKGEYENKAYWLNSDFEWKIQKDQYGMQCLIPVKKK